MGRAYDGEVTVVEGRDLGQTESLGDRDDRRVNQPEPKIVIRP